MNRFKNTSSNVVQQRLRALEERKFRVLNEKKGKKTALLAVSFSHLHP